MPLQVHTLNDLPQSHLDDHNGLIKTVVDAFEGTTPASFKAAGAFQTAAQTPFTPAGTIAATQVQNALVEVATDAATALAAHEADTTSVHGIADTAALETQIGAQIRVNTHVNDTTAAHAAAAVSFNPLSSGLSSTDVNAAVIEVKNLIPGGVTSVTSPLGFPLSGFSGANDDARLVNYNNARNAAGSGLHGWPCLLDQNRIYTFTQPITVSDGFSVVGGIRPVDQARGQSSANVPLGVQVNLRLPSAGGWLAFPGGTTFGVSLVGLSFDANSNSRVFAPHSTAVVWTTQLRDVSYQNGPGVIGSSATRMGIDALTIEGWCNWNNLRDVGYNVGGSDAAVNCTKFLIDSPPTFKARNAGYLVQYTAVSKTDTTGIYMTCEGHSGMLLTGGNNMLTFKRCFIEGRNEGDPDPPPTGHGHLASAPCDGALVRISCDYSQWESCWFAHAMINPAGGSNPGDLGYVHITSGTHEFINCHTRLAHVNNPATTSTIYATGAGTKVIVRNMIGEGQRNLVSGGQSDGVPFKPRVRVVGGATADVDTSVTLVTV